MVHQICNWAKYQNKHSSKSIKVIKLSFYQNDSPMGGSFWQKDSLITYILFELCLFWYLSPVANFKHHSLSNHDFQPAFITFCENWRHVASTLFCCIFDYSSSLLLIHTRYICKSNLNMVSVAELCWQLHKTSRVTYLNELMQYDQ